MFSRSEDETDTKTARPSPDVSADIVWGMSGGLSGSSVLEEAFEAQVFV